MLCLPDTFLTRILDGMMTTLGAVILAAGQGTRFNSKRQKILHEVGGRPMVAHVFEAILAVVDLPPVIVVAPGEEGVKRLFGQKAHYAEQPEPLGTGQATMMAAPLLQGRSDQVLVTYADMPLLKSATMARLAGKQAESEAAVVMLSAMGEPSSSFGRVVRDKSGRVTEIVEVAEAKQRGNTAALLAIRELNVGVYCFAAGWLWENLASLPQRKARAGLEYYLTDMVGLAVAQNEKVETLEVESVDECLGAGTRQELVAVEGAFRKRANVRWLAAGVTLIDPETTFIDQTVVIGRDTIIWPNSYLQGKTIIGEDCVLGPSAIIRDAKIGNHCRIEQAVVENTILSDGVMIEPFSHIVGNRGNGEASA